ncbi:MAG: toprim domain-containing protein [Bacteroidia bacterium]|nr:toprim domain-containing protein [Bacteroidia bacterium]
MADLKVINLADSKEYIIDVQKNGENQMTCPECSPTRKKKTLKCFSFNLGKNAGRCNHCGIVLVSKQDIPLKLTQIEYKRPKWKNSTKLSNNVVKWFEGRNISQYVLNDFKITNSVEWMPQTQKNENVINFNYFRLGELINVKYRDGAKNFKLFGGGELIFYNLDACIDNKEIIIVEGEMDVLALAQCGIKNAISVPNGCTEKGNINLDYLDNCIDFFESDTQFILALDNDKVGRRLQDELARRLGYENCKTVTFKDCKDANDCLIKYGYQTILDCLKEAKEFPIIGVFNANDISNNIYDFYNNGLPKGVGIDMSEFDNLLRFQEGYLTTITGIPGHGKSEFLDFLLCRLNITNDWKFALYSPENHPLELHFSKFAEKIIGKPFEGANRMSPLDLKSMIDYHASNFFFINPENDFGLENILDSVRQLVRKKGVKAFVIDAWNKLDHKYTTNETKYISEQLDKIVRFCEINKVHCFLVAHPTKIQKDKATGKYEIPNLYSISGSANFYNKTANGITVYRDYEKFTTEVYVQKVKFKHWGETGCVQLAWDKSNGRYYKGTPTYDSWIYLDKPKELPINNDFLTQTNDIVINNNFSDTEF